MIIGGIANDRVILTLDRYFEGELSKEQALGLLMYEKPNIQFCIRSQQMLDECLKYRECKIMTEVSKQIYKGIKCANVIAALS